MSRCGVAGMIFAAAACGESVEPAVVIRPAWDGARRAVAPEVHGHNTVWSRGGLGLWDEARGEIDAAVWPHVEALAPGLLRFPGGTRGLRWHFAGTIGPAAARTPQCDAFTGTLDGTAYGLGEMVAVARRAGAAMALVTPLSDGSPEEAAAMLAFVAGDAASTVALGTDRAGLAWGTAGSWAARRDGAAVPVTLVEVGNEPYLGLGVGPGVSCGRSGQFHQNERWEGDVRIPFTAAEYAAQVRATAAALRAVDPDIVVGAAAMTSFSGRDDVATVVGDHDRTAGDAWNPRLVADAGDSFDAFVLHPYDFAGADERVALAERARREGRTLLGLAPDKRIAVTELGTLFDADSMLNAIITADFLRVAVEEDWLARVRHILIEDDPSEPFATSAAILGPELRRTPGWEVSRLLARDLRSHAVTVAVDGDGDVVALATIDAAGADLAVVIIDRRIGAEATELVVRVALPAGAWSGTSARLDGPALTSTEVTVSEVALAGDGAVDLTVPPTSVTVVRLAR